MMQQDQTENPSKCKSIVRPFYAWSAIAVVLILGIGLLMPISSQCRCGLSGHESHLRFDSQARSLSQGLVIYATENNDMFPSQDQWPDILLELGLIEPELLVSRVKDDDSMSYIYVPGAVLFDSTQILIYEDPKHYEEGVVVAFADTHVEMVDHETFEQMLAEQLAAQSELP